MNHGTMTLKSMFSGHRLKKKKKTMRNEKEDWGLIP